MINRMQSMKKPKLFWVSAGAPLLSVIVSTLLVFVFRADRHGISVVSFPFPLYMTNPLFPLAEFINFFIWWTFRLENYKKV